MPTATIHLLSNVRAKVTGEFDHGRLSDLLAFRPPGYKFMAAFRRHVWDGYIRLLTAEGTFPAGLVPMVESDLFDQGVTVERRSDVHVPAFQVKHTRDIKLQGVKLYPWQAKSVRVAVEKHRGILKIATGGGKTEVMAGIIASLTGDKPPRDRPPKTLVVVPNRNLVKQAKDRLEARLGYEVGVISDGKWNEDWVTVAIPNTLILPKWKAARIQLLKATELLMLDETHHATASTWSTVVNRCNAYYRFGLSGTPLDRADGASLKLIGCTGPLLVDISSSLLVSQGRLAKPTVQFVDVKKPVLPKGLVWADTYGLGIVNNKHFHSLVGKEVRKHVAAGKQVLVLVTRIDHGQHLQAELQNVYDFAYGGLESEDINEMLTKFREEKTKCLIASAIFGEGTDVPGIDVLVIADGGKSVIKTVQKAGRAMRAKSGKPNECLIVDFTHWTSRQLLEHSQERAATYAREEFEVINPPKESA